jgi:hypothetical protein
MSSPIRTDTDSDAAVRPPDCGFFRKLLENPGAERARPVAVLFKRSQNTPISRPGDATGDGTPIAFSLAHGG